MKNTIQYYQTNYRNNGNAFQVFVLDETEKMTLVRTQGDLPIEFWCRKTSLYSI